MRLPHASWYPSFRRANHAVLPRPIAFAQLYYSAAVLAADGYYCPNSGQAIPKTDTGLRIFAAIPRNRLTPNGQIIGQIGTFRALRLTSTRFEQNELSRNSASPPSDRQSQSVTSTRCALRLPHGNGLFFFLRALRRLDSRPRYQTGRRRRTSNKWAHHQMYCFLLVTCQSSLPLR